MYNNQYMLESLTRQKDRIDELIKSYQQPQPVNNFITTGQITPRDAVELRVLNENEEVDNLYVQTKTLFLSENMMVLKGVDGSLEKWEIKKTYPNDKNLIVYKCYYFLMMMSMLNPSQKELISQFQSKSGTDQAQAIADFCNKNGITKDKLQEIIGMLNKK